MESLAVSQTASRPKVPDVETSLPDKPLVVIKASTSWAPINLRELWAHRELLYFLVWRELKVRYKQTIFGVVWVVLQPILMTLIFTVFLGYLARVPSNGIPYALFVFTGLTVWTFISTAVVTCSASLVGNANLVTKIYCPRIIIPTASIIARLVDFGIAFVILIILALYYGVTPTRSLLMLPVVLVLMTVFSLGLGISMSALNVRYRDISIALPVALQLCMFLSPVIYPVTLVPERWQGIYSMNPLVGIIQSFRNSMLGGQFDWWSLGIASVVSVCMLVVGAYIFTRTESSFADII